MLAVVKLPSLLEHLLKESSEISSPLSKGGVEY